MVEKLREVRFAIFDSFGKLLGYQSDTFWGISDESQSSTRSLEEVTQSKDPVNTLVFFLNNAGWWRVNQKQVSAGKFDDHGTIYVVAQDARTKEEVCRYSFRRKGERYCLNQPG